MDLKTNPGDIVANYYLGLSILLQEKYGEALEIFQKVEDDRQNSKLPNKPTVPDGYQIQIALAQANLGLKQDAEAWKNLEAAEKENPNSADTYVYRGVYYIHRENLPEAVKQLEEAIRLDKDNPYAFYWAGHAFLRTGNPARAVEMFKTFLQLAPYAPEAEKAKVLISALC